MFRLLEDIRWAARAVRARRYRRRLLFSERMRFDAALRPQMDSGRVMAYPDAFYHVGSGDLIRAVEENSGFAATPTT